MGGSAVACNNKDCRRSLAAEAGECCYLMCVDAKWHSVLLQYSTVFYKIYFSCEHMCNH